MDPARQDPEPFVIPETPPPPPPPIPGGRRLRGLLARFWPLLAWIAAAAFGLWLYFGESWHGHALAYADIRELRVSPQVAGRLTTLSVEVGQEVRAGDPIATLDTRDLEARIRLVRAEVERLRARVAAERESLTLVLLNLRNQGSARERAYEVLGQRLRFEIEKLTIEQAADQAELDALGPQVERLRPLVEKKLVTADRFEELSQRKSIVSSRMASRTPSLRDAQAQFKAWHDLKPEALPDLTLDARLLPYEQEQKAEEVRLAELELEREKYRVTAPATGAVHQVSFRPGEWVTVGSAIVEIVVPQPGRVIAYVTDRQVPVVKIGTRAVLRSRDQRGGQALEGRVIAEGARIEQVPLRLRFITTVPQWGRLITIMLDKPDGLLAGEIYDVRFHR